MLRSPTYSAARSWVRSRISWPVPGRLLGIGGDRAEADRKPVDRAAGRLGGGLDLGYPLPDAVQRLAPEGVHVGVPAADPDRVLGRAAEVDRQVPAGRADRRQRALHLVELALVVEALGRRPLALDDVEELVGAAVAGRLVGEVAVAGLVGVVAAGDHVQGDPAGVERVDRGVLAGGDRRGDEAGPVRQQHAEPFGRVQDLAGDHEPVGHGRAVRDEHPVEAGLLVHAGDTVQVIGLDDGPRQCVGLGVVAGVGDSDELDRHEKSPCVVIWQCELF